MKTLQEIRNDVWEILDSSSSDAFHPPDQIDSAINHALRSAFDNLLLIGAAGRWLTVARDVANTPEWDDQSNSWELPQDFVKLVSVKQNNTLIPEAVDIHDFNVSRRKVLLLPDALEFSDGVNLANLDVYYIRRPAELVADTDEPEWFEGKEPYLVLKAAEYRLLKGDAGDPRMFAAQAQMMWRGIMAAARRNSNDVAVIRRRNRWMRRM